MGIFTEHAAKLDKGLLSHPWARQLRAGLEAGCPKLFAELEAEGELDAFIMSRVSDANEMADEMIAKGTPRSMAEEFVKSELIPDED